MEVRPRKSGIYLTQLADGGYCTSMFLAHEDVFMPTVKDAEEKMLVAWSKFERNKDIDDKENQLIIFSGLLYSLKKVQGG